MNQVVICPQFDGNQSVEGAEYHNYLISRKQLISQVLLYIWNWWQGKNAGICNIRILARSYLVLQRSGTVNSFLPMIWKMTAILQIKRTNKETFELCQLYGIAHETFFSILKNIKAVESWASFPLCLEYI